jgi:hypothetical protein
VGTPSEPVAANGDLSGVSALVQLAEEAAALDQAQEVRMPKAKPEKRVRTQAEISAQKSRKRNAKKSGKLPKRPKTKSKPKKLLPAEIAFRSADSLLLCTDAKVFSRSTCIRDSFSHSCDAAAECA